MARSYRFILRNPQSTALLDRAEAGFQLTEAGEPDIVFQLVKVLRVKNGDVVTLLPQDQVPPFREFDFEVASSSKKSVELVRKGVRQNENELGFSLDLLLCLPNKPDKLEFMVQKAVEIGVKNITLLEGDFSQMKHQLRMERLKKILLEAAEQSERAVVPGIVEEGGLAKYLLSLDDAGRGRIRAALERQGAVEVAEQKSSGGNPFAGADRSRGLAVLVGPEGGFSDGEKALFHKIGLRTFSLGKRILRMETAVILGLGLAALAGS